jgi:hypothetical protein
MGYANIAVTASLWKTTLGSLDTPKCITFGLSRGHNTRSQRAPNPQL